MKLLSSNLMDGSSIDKILTFHVHYELFPTFDPLGCHIPFEKNRGESSRNEKILLTRMLLSVDAYIRLEVLSQYV